MPPSRSILAYPDIQSVLDQALTTERGLTIRFDNRARAVRFCHRANYFRTLAREINKKVYVEEAHSLHGRSVYDVLTIRSPKAQAEEWVVLVEKIAAEKMNVEEIK